MKRRLIFQMLISTLVTIPFGTLYSWFILATRFESIIDYVEVVVIALILNFIVGVLFYNKESKKIDYLKSIDIKEQEVKRKVKLRYVMFDSSYYNDAELFVYEKNVVLVYKDRKNYASLVIEDIKTLELVPPYELYVYYNSNKRVVLSEKNIRNIYTIIKTRYN